MKLSPQLPLLSALFVFAATSGRSGDVLISEIMYHAAPAVPESNSWEWVELYNKGTNAVNLDGWKFTKGISFTFSHTTLAPGGYLVLAADRIAFNSRYPGVTNVVGDWLGTLSNNGDELKLENATGATEDDVSYASQGDWAIRVRGPYDRGHYGWDWFTEADGLGKSLELVNPALPNHYGQNWSASVALGGTPGALNSATTNDTPPLIVDATHSPAIPASIDPVAVTARILDESSNGIGVTLFFRDSSSATPPPFSSLTMFDDGAHGDGLADDRVFGAIIPPLANNTVIEFYVQATDNGGRTRTYPGPAQEVDGSFVQAANLLFQVDDSTYAGNQPLYRLIMTEAERFELDQIGLNVGGAADSDAAMNGTFISVDGVGTELRYTCSFRNRGHGSRTARPNNVRVNFPNDHPWKGARAAVLNSRYTQVQTFGSAVFQKAGMPMAFSRPVQVRVNNQNLAVSGSPMFGSYAHNEELSSEFVQNHFPLDPRGNCYRGIRVDPNMAYANLNYYGPNFSDCAVPPACYANLYFKQNNASEDDFSDLIELCRVLGTTPDSDYAAQVRRVLDVEDAMLYFAVNTLADNRETSLSNGEGDDYAMYRGGIDPRFKLFPYDVDTLFGQGDSAGQTTASLFRMTNTPPSGVDTVNTSIIRFMTWPEFTPIYYATLKKQAESTFSAAQFNPLVDRVLGGWVPQGTRDAMKAWMANRAAFVLSRIPTNLTITAALSVVNGYPYTAVDTVVLGGTANIIETRSVRVNGVPVSWDYLSGNWLVTDLALQPGINRVLVQTFGTNGTELARGTIDIWYDNSTAATLSGTLPGDTSVTAAGGPYQVTANVTVPAGVTLNIEAGTTLFLSPGVTITVNGLLVAQGTDTQHVRLTRPPGSLGNWGSLDFINSSVQSRLAYVDFDSCGGTTIGGHNAQLHVNNAMVFIDHCTWPPTPVVEYISFDGSSFIVQNCIFPTYPPPTGPEMLHGVNGIPAGGYGIFRDNYFGHTYGFNDTIDFTGGQRPGAILQVINNVFDGASDDHLDLDSTDAWIEGNIFLHAHRDPTRTDDARDTASAISGGVDFANQFSEWTIINNLFYDVDHACLNKGGGSPGAGRFVFVNNTLVHVAKENGGGLVSDIAAFDFTDDGVPLPDPSYGAGAYVAGNIIWDCPALVANYNPANQTVIFENNLLPLPWTGPGTNNVVADPRLNLDLITSVATADWRTIQAAFRPRAGSPALGTGLGGFDKGGLNPRGLLVFGQPPGTNHSTSATLTVGPGGTFNWGSVVPPYLWGYTHYQWRLDAGPWSAEIPITTSPTIHLSDLSDGPHTVSVVGKNDAGYYQDDTFVYPATAGIPAHVSASRAWTVDTTSTRLVINEVLARNTSTLTVNGEFPDLIELYNAGATGIDLSGYGITDDPSDKFKFTFAPATFLEPGDYLVLYADNAAGPGLHLNFALDQEGDGVHLYATNGALVDEVVFGPQLPDLSIARRSDGSWGLGLPTFPGPNVAAPVGETRTLKINEWLASGQGIFGQDFVELYNPDPLPVNLGGHFISDAPQGAPRKHEYLPLTFLPGSGFSAFFADGKPEEGGDHLDFKLSPDWGQLALFAPDLTLIDCIAYGAQTLGQSEGRRPSGSTNFAFFSQPTPGAANPGGSDTTTITISNIFVQLLDVTGSTWRWDNSGFDLADSWRQVGFDDSAWLTGTGLFGFETTPAVYPYPFNTFIPAPNQAGGQITVYYRTHFLWTNQSGFALFATNYLDDGAVFYINNVAVGRLRLTANPVLYTTRAATQTAEGQAEVLTFPTNALVNGDNVMAVEVHQQTLTSSDDVFGLSLAAIKSQTNIITTSVALVLNEVLADNATLTNAEGTMTDWIELYNPSTNLTDLAGMSLTDDVTLPRKWVVPAGVTLAAGAYLLVRCEDGAPASTNNGPVLNTGFGLNSAGDEVYLFDTPARGSALIDVVVFGVQAADFSIGRVPGGTGQWVLNLPTPGAPNLAAALGDVNQVRINEWLANPKSGDNDYFELYNPNRQPVAIGGLYLTDDLNTPHKFPIAPLSFIGSFTNGFAKFIADSSPTKGPNHVNFGLSQNGEEIGFFPAHGPAIDVIAFGAQAVGVSEGRLPDGSTNLVRFVDTLSPGESNYLPLDEVRINEVLTHTDLPFEDAIELFNVSTRLLNLGGWYLSDSVNELRKFRIPDGTTLQPGGFVVFYEFQFNPLPGFPPSFALSAAHGDQVHLSVADALGNFTGRRTSVKFGAAENGVSFGRFETSVGEEFTAMSARSFGVDNPATVELFRTGTGLPNPYPKVGPVVINEIMYHPPRLGTNDNVVDEFIELRNLTANAVSLFNTNFPANSWKLRDAVDFVFPPNAHLAANELALVVSFSPTNLTQVNAFRTRYGVSPGVAIFGPYSGKLDNGGESVELARPDDPLPPPASDAGFVPYVLLDRVKYSDALPWASLADGNTNGVGMSLQRRSGTGYGNDPTNWIAGVPTPGSATGAPGLVPPSVLAQPQSQVAIAGSNVTFSVSTLGDPPLSFQWRFNGSVIAGATSSNLTLFNVQSNAEGRYTVLISNPAGAASSMPATFTLQSPPVITQSPRSRVVAAGDTAAFTVGVSGAPPLRYQWHKDSGTLTGATNATLLVTNAQVADQGGYFIVVTNTFGSATSLVATLTINTPPAITAQPQSQTVHQADTASFSVTATGSAPLSYRWRLNETDIPGANSPSLVLANVLLSQSGDYTVVVTNLVGSVTSVVARLTVVPLPAVSIVATDPNAAETGPQPGTFTVTRSVVTNTPLAVNFSIGGTAANGVDYVALFSPVTIPANAASAPISVTPIDDSVSEFPESVVCTIQPGAGYVLGAPPSATVTIADNDNLAPTVVITNPPSGTLFLLTPTNIAIYANAADPDGSVSKVEFFWRATNKIGEATSAPFKITWTNAPPGSNALTAVATDNFDGSGTSAPVYLVLNALPTANISSPNNGASFAEPANINLSANAGDSDGTVTQVLFFAGTNLIGTAVNSPYNVSWTDVPVGNYALTARAIDNRGASGVSAPVNIVVNTGLPIFTDNFPARNTVSGSLLTISGSNAGATAEPGEPNPNNLRNDNTVWIAWRAGTDSLVTIDTTGSAFDTVLAVYTGNVLSTLNLIAFNDDFNGVQSLVTFNATAGTIYDIQVASYVLAGPGSITLHVATQSPAPHIVTQPASRSVTPSTATLFTVAVIGSAPLSYQWRFNGVDLPRETNSSMLLTNVQAPNEGAYSVVVTNPFGRDTSVDALLTVDDGLVVNQVVRLVDLGSSWRYEQSGHDLGTTWSAPGFDDSAWPSGLGLLGFETTPQEYPEPFRTTLNITTNGVTTLTYYFRTHLQFTNSGAIVGASVTGYIDDGAVWYLNGSEIYRVRMPSGTVRYSTLAQLQNNEGLPDFFALNPTSLLLGDNVLAAEVHQANAGSSDIVFGTTVDVSITSTNHPAIINPRLLTGARFQATLTGISGRRYAVDTTTALGAAWTTLTNFNSFTGQATFIDSAVVAGSSRFYRARLVR